MRYQPVDTGRRWTSDDHQRASAGLTARSARNSGPCTGDLLIHPDGQRTRLWITEYSGAPFSIGEDPDFGFILAADGTVDYTGTESRLTNTPITLDQLTDSNTTAPADFWVDRLDEELPGDVLQLVTEVRVWHTSAPAADAR